MNYSSFEKFQLINVDRMGRQRDMENCRQSIWEKLPYVLIMLRLLWQKLESVSIATNDFSLQNMY